MKNTFGQSVAVTIFGESHGENIGVVLDGIAPGIPVDMNYIMEQMELRKPHGKISTKRVEADVPKFVSGVFEGKTTGTSICILLENAANRSKDYARTRDLARPGHADYTAEEKYHGFQDYRGGGHFSGRLTAGIVAAGALAKQILEQKNIFIGSHILQCGEIRERTFGKTEKDIREDICRVNKKLFPVLEEEAERKMLQYMEAAAEEGDSVGGILQTAVTGLEPGLGEPWFDSVESCLAHGLFSIPAVKGVEFGLGFDFAGVKGSEGNDAFSIKDGKVITKTNHNGGINGGITNGMPVVFQTVIKPTPSIYKPQETIDFKKKTQEVIQIEGRHDPAIIHRARVVADSMTALVLLDLLALRNGTDWMR